MDVDKYQDDSEPENETNYVDIHQINLLKGNCISSFQYNQGQLWTQTTNPPKMIDGEYEKLLANTIQPFTKHMAQCRPFYSYFKGWHP